MPFGFFIFTTKYKEVVTVYIKIIINEREQAEDNYKNLVEIISSYLPRDSLKYINNNVKGNKWGKGEGIKDIKAG